MHCFRNAELYLCSLIDSFDVLAISENCLFDEQLGTFTSKCNNNYNCIAPSSNENPPCCQEKWHLETLLYCGKFHLTITLVF